MIQLIWQALALVLGFAFTSIVCYLANHHVKIRVAGQEVDTSNAIKDLITATAKWGVASAAKENQWNNEEKKLYVRNLIIHGLETMPVPVKDAAKYTPLIDAAIESALAGYKLAQDQATTPKEETKTVDAPTPVIQTEPIKTAENANDQTLAKVGQDANQEQLTPKVSD